MLHYSSCRPFAKVAEGLLLGCADYFNNAFTLSVADSEQPSDHEISFQLLRTKKSA
ncbi:heme NO-binding domain-containing protein [bacterium]|nr:heme NO-binding domain-containing protein [bacterium]